ncbi:SCO-spondin-like [Bolinopsis microptera]|uniref:SCO-spondin-like n=1 Tax=Bolinopsis microptera TaxID=2820187 RepID=UPI00307A5377
MKKNQRRKCTKKEGYLKKCGYTCPDTVELKEVYSKKETKKCSRAKKNFGGPHSFVDNMATIQDCVNTCASKDNCAAINWKKTKWGFRCFLKKPGYGKLSNSPKATAVEMCCLDNNCPVDGGWGEYGAWSECSDLCGGGTQTRSRDCNNPAPANGGEACAGKDVETQSCNDKLCSIPGLFAQKQVGKCSNEKKNLNGPHTFVDDLTTIQDCVNKCASKDNCAAINWKKTKWGFRCFLKKPGYGKLSNSPKATAVEMCCLDNTCPVDGDWGEYGAWSKCSAECNGGTQIRSKECNNPVPANGGAACVGDDVQTQSCNSDPCAVNGGWSEYGAWSKCSAECGGKGTQIRSKECNNPAPANGGAACVGDDVQTQSCNSDPCAVNGGWSEYGAWSKCSAVCGGKGTQIRSKECNNPAPANGGAACVGDDVQTQSCNSDPCAVNGGWSEYGAWSKCSAECNGGTQIRSKECNNPAPANGGAACVGDDSQTQSCNSDPCAVNGGWSEYGAWSKCSAECGGGTQIRSKECNNPAPANGGAACVGDDSQTQSCNSDPCSVDGGWGEYGAWSECSDLCGGGTQIRSKECNNPAPVNGGAACVGDDVQTQSCNSDPCSAVDGGWSEYGAWSKCSAECGGKGTQIRSKECSNPAPVNGGAACVGDDSQTRSCNSEPCIVDGEWGDFGAWSQCTADCGVGTKTRYRECSNPAPVNGGAACVGDDSQTRSCNSEPCIVDGEWGDFGAWSQCTADCGVGTKTRYRKCSSPAPGIGGAYCSGQISETYTCNSDPCPVNGGWGEYGAWSKCSAVCGGKGTQIRSKQCNNPAPANGGAACVGDDSQTQSCNSDPCAVNGGWGEYGAWSKCSAVCGGKGTQIRSKECNNPAPANGGAACVGDDVQTQSCNSDPCAVNGGWSEYGAWSKCSAECGGKGTQIRSKECNNPAPANGGAACVGDDSQTQSCNSDPCAVNGGWSEYGAWSKCSAECNGGTQIRSKQCNNPAPANGGAACVGDDSQTQSCNSDPCAVNGGWGEYGAWSKCSAVCGGKGTQIRSKQCNNPAPANGGAACVGDDSQTQSCNSDPCAVNGGWSEYGAWSTCSAECGGKGTQIRSKECNNPAPANGGSACVGDDVQTQSCNSDPCAVNGGWGEYGAWSKCSAVCGGKGTQIRSKECNNPAPAKGGSACVGDDVQTQSCNSDPCSAVDGGWGEYGAWSKCSAVCGGKGTQIRSKECNNPAPANGGAVCVGDDVQTQSCNSDPCPACDKSLGKVAQISKGKAGMWGVDSEEDVFKLDTGRLCWAKVTGGKLTKVSSGATVWGIGPGRNVYKYLGGDSWLQLPGDFVDVDVSDNDNVWGVASNHDLFRWTASTWERIPGKARKVKVTPEGVWAMGEGNEILFRTGTYGDQDISGIEWEDVSGRLNRESSPITAMVPTRSALLIDLILDIDIPDQACVNVPEELLDVLGDKLTNQ